MEITLLHLSLSNNMFVGLDCPNSNCGKNFVLGSKCIPECSSRMSNMFAVTVTNEK